METYWLFFVLSFLQILSNSLESDARTRKDRKTCPGDFVRVHNKCMFFSNSTASWQSAYHECRERHSSFVVIKGTKLNKALKTFLMRKKHHIRPDERWIGGIYDWEQKQWKWTGSQRPMKFKDFYYEKQGNASAWECIILDPKNQYRWNSRSCLLQKPYICQFNIKRDKKGVANKFNGNRADNEIPVISPAKTSKEIQQHGIYDDLIIPGYLRTQPPTNKPIRKRVNCPSDYLQVRNKCYHFSTKKLTWHEAYWSCNEMNATLATFDTNKEDVALKNAIKKHNKPITSNWIGGKYDWEQMAWKWASSGKLIQYELNGVEEMRWHCLLWNPKLHNRWLAESCFGKHNFICQKSPNVMNIFKSRKLLTYPPPVPHVKIDFSVDGKRTSEKLYEMSRV